MVTPTKTFRAANLNPTSQKNAFFVACDSDELFLPGFEMLLIQKIIWNIFT